MDIGVKEIDRWHKQRGWSGIGYHYVIRRNGAIENGRPIEKIGAHVRGHNAYSIGICLVGGKDIFDFSRSQMDKLEILLYGLLDKFPNAVLLGHRDLQPAKACPRYDVEAWWNE